MWRLRRIVTVYTGTPESLRALDRAVHLAEECGATLTVAVSELPPPAPNATDPAGALPLASPSPLPPPVHSGSYLQEARDHLADRRVVADFVSVVDANDIVQVADDRDADLIVVGTHDSGRLERLFAGDVSTPVVRKAPCDVLVVH